MKKFIREWGVFILIVIALLLSRVFIWSLVVVDGHSMDPTLADKERLVMVKVGDPQRFDIVVAHEDNPGQDIVKRVIGLPGDTITFDNDQLTINGKKYDEPYLAEFKKQFDNGTLAQTYGAFPLNKNLTEANRDYFVSLAKNNKAFTVSASQEANFTVKVPEGQYFLMGDDRTVSADSRVVGAFKRKDITGIVKLRIWPLNKISYLG